VLPTGAAQNSRLGYRDISKFMNTRIRRLSRRLFNVATTLSLMLLIPVTVIALFSDHFHHKEFRVGQLEILLHHDYVITSWGPIAFSGDVDNRLSLDETWIGFDADIVNAEQLGKKWLFTLNVTQQGLVGITAVLPLIWAFIYFWRKNKENSERFPI
jgi:amino acid transporter